MESSKTTPTASSSTTNQDEQNVYIELIGFLKSTTRIDLRWYAIQAVHQLLSSSSSSNNNNNDEQIQCLVFDYNIISILISLCSDDSIILVPSTSDTTDTDTENKKEPQSISLVALQCLLQLCSSTTNSERYIQEVVSSGIVRRLVELVLTTRLLLPSTTSTSTTTTINIETISPTIQMARRRIYWSLALLANVTRTEQGSIELVGTSLPDHAVYHHQHDDHQDGQDQDGSTTTTSTNPTLILLLGRFLNPQYQYCIPIPSTSSSQGGVVSSTLYDDSDSDDDDVSDNENDDNDETKNNTNQNTTNDIMKDDISDPYQHFATVLMNITQIELGRKFVLQIPTSTTTSTTTTKQSSSSSSSSSEQPLPTVLQRVLPQLRLPPTMSSLSSTSTTTTTTTLSTTSTTTTTSTNNYYDLAIIRRRGIAGMIRNCCLDTNSAWWLINIVHIISPHLLYPLAGPEALTLEEKKGLHVDLWMNSYEKQRDLDMYTRLYVVEAILLLCASGRPNRQSIRLDKPYIILKYCDMVETNETVSERINECVQYLRRDEMNTYEGSSDDYITKYYNKTTTTKTTTTNNDKNNNEDDEDADHKVRLQLPPSTSVMIGAPKKSRSSSSNTTTTTTNHENYDTVD